LESRHLAGIATWLVVILLLATGSAARVALARPALWSIGLILALAAWTLFSSFWSGSVERTFAEAGRVLVYLGFFLAAFLIAQTNNLRQRFAEGLAVAVVVVAVLGLGSRLLPDLIAVDYSGGPRLGFPLGYWNATGAMVGIGVALLLWLRRSGSSSFLRWLGAGAIPICLLTLYFTYSRGGLLAGLVAVAALLTLSHDRLRHLLLIAAATIVTIPAVLAVQSRRELADDDVESSAIAGQGVEVLVILILGIAALLGLIWLFGRAENRLAPLVNRGEDISRNPRILKVIGAAAAVAAILLVILAGGKAWDQFSDPDVYFPDAPEEHFGQLSGAGRYDFWRVAVESFRENPLTGTGAGTYAFSWRQDRSIDLIIQDAHSVYLEPLAELGVPGALLVFAVFLALFWIGLAAWSRDLRQSRERSAMMLAVMAGFAVAAGLDWFWEMAALGAVFFLFAGVLLGVRCAQARSAQEPGLFENKSSRYAMALGGIALGWVSIAILAGPLLMQLELRQSQSAAAAGDIAGAADHALSARSLQPWAASPYIQLGGLAELEGNHTVAFEHYHEATKRETDNWQAWLLASGAAQAAGDETTADRYLERARELNPMAPEFDPEAVE